MLISRAVLFFSLSLLVNFSKTNLHKLVYKRSTRTSVAGYMWEFHRLCSNFCVDLLRRILAKRVFEDNNYNEQGLTKKQPCVSYRRASGDDATKKVLAS